MLSDLGECFAAANRSQSAFDKRGFFERHALGGACLPELEAPSVDMREHAEELRARSLAAFSCAAYHVALRQASFRCVPGDGLHIVLATDAERAERTLEAIVALYRDATSNSSSGFWVDNSDRRVLVTGRNHKGRSFTLGDPPIDTLCDRVGAVADHYNALTLISEAPRRFVLESEREKARADRENHKSEYAAAAAIIRRLGLKKLY